MSSTPSVRADRFNRVYVRIEGLSGGDLDAAVAVVALGGELDAASPSVDGVGPAGLVGWMPVDRGDLTAEITDDVDLGATARAPGQWPIVTSLDGVPRDGTHFAWGAEIDAPDGRDMPERVAMWTALIDAGARVLITRHGAEAKRVAVLVSDLLALQASPAQPSSPTSAAVN